LTPEQAIAIFNNALTERGITDIPSGEFTPSIVVVAGQIAAYLNEPTPSRTFETLFSVSTECGDDEVLISLTINDTVDANAGEFEDVTLACGTDSINLEDLENLDSEASSG